MTGVTVEYPAHRNKPLAACMRYREATQKMCSSEED